MLRLGRIVAHLDVFASHRPNNSVGVKVNAPPVLQNRFPGLPYFLFPTRFAISIHRSPIGGAILRLPRKLRRKDTYRIRLWWCATSYPKSSFSGVRFVMFRLKRAVAWRVVGFKFVT